MTGETRTTHAPGPGGPVFRRAWAAFAGLAFLNELGTNLHGLASRFRDAKVINSLGDEADAALAGLLGEVAVMLALAATLTALLWLPWAAVCATVFGRWRARHGESRAARLGFWAVAGFAGLHLVYSLHGLLWPGSRLADSPLVVGVGAFDGGALSWSSPRLALLPLTAAAVLGASAWALAVSPPLRRGTLAAALVLGAGLPLYERATGVGPVRRFDAPGSVVVLGLDSFQENRLGLGGGPADLAPHIDGFLADSFRFDNAWTPFARTYPSWVSLFTGRYPVRHGVRFNLVPDSHLSADNRYLADELAAAGHSTLHATDETRFSIIRERFGFEKLVHPVMGLPDFLVGTFFDFGAVNLARQSAAGHDLFPLLADNRAVTGYNPRLWVRSFLKELNALPADRPVFATAHLCGNHWPFTTPWPYWLESPDPDRPAVEACVAMVDEQVGLILEHLEAAGLRETGTVVLLSDHGDGWTGDVEDTANTHGDHLERLLANKVLLGIQRPGLAPGRSDALVRTLDLYPTLLEWAGRPADPATIDGRSLTPLLAGGDGGDGGGERTLFAESGFDKKTFFLSVLAERADDWYRFDPQTLLVHLDDAGYERLLDGKSYMYMEDGMRLHLAPRRGLFRVTTFDPSTGVEQDLTDEVPAARRRAMLEALVDHYGLARDELLALARRRGFLEST